MYVTRTFRPGFSPARASESEVIVVTGVSPIRVMTSPTRSPASAAAPSSSTLTIATPAGR